MTAARKKQKTVLDLHAMKASGEKIAVLTAYDYPFARMMDQAGVDVILVGDSVGSVVAGYDNTLPVTMDEMIYHTLRFLQPRKEELKSLIREAETYASSADF